MNKLLLKAIVFGVSVAGNTSHLSSASHLVQFERCIQASKTDLEKYFCHRPIERRYAFGVQSQVLERHLNIWNPELVRETRGTLDAIKSYEERPNDENRSSLQRLERKDSYGHRLVASRLAETAAESPTPIEAKLRVFVRAKVEAVRAFDLCKENDDRPNCFQAHGAYLDASEKVEELKKTILREKILTEQNLRAMSDCLWQEESSRK